MAFATIKGTAGGVQSSNSTTHTISVPDSLSTGDIVIVAVVSDGNGTQSWGGPTWSGLQAGGGATIRLEVKYRIINGTEGWSGTGNSFTVTTSANENSAHRSWAYTAGTYGSIASAITSGTSATPDPPNLTSGFGAVDTTWIAIAGVDNGSTTVNSFPANYELIESGFFDNSNGSGGVAVGTCRRQLNAASENPGTFSISASRFWRSITVALQGSAPAPSSGSGTPTDDRDTTSGTATFTSSATGAATDDQDAASGSAQFSNNGDGTPTDTQDTASGTATFTSSATGTPTDDQDTASGSATFAGALPTVAAENALTGATLPGISGYGDSSNQGYADELSIDAGNTLNFKVDGDCEQIDIYRLGHYGGDNARFVASISNTPTSQGNETTITDSNGATTLSWTTTASWAVPGNALSGLYVAFVRNAALNNGSYIPFVVRNDSRTADIVVGIPTATWALAYNHYGGPSAGITGGKNLYGSGTYLGAIGDRAYAVSANRPIISRGGVQNHWDDYDWGLIDYLEESGFDVKYVASHDLERDATSFNDALIYISVGHDEYWSQGMRDNVEAFRDAGGHCIFMSANEVFWRVRWADSYRTMWCYKDTMPGPGGHTAGDPLDPVSWTGTWRDVRWGSSNPESNLTGTFFRMNGLNWRTVTVVAGSHGSSPFWRDTTVETGPTDLVVANLIGFEADEVSIPATYKRVQLAGTTTNIDGNYADGNGQNYNGNGTLNWGIVMTQNLATSGVVVAFGTMAWCNALSDVHDSDSTYPAETAAIRQATANLLYDLGATADTLAVATTPTPVTDVITDYGVEAPATGGDYIWQGATPSNSGDATSYELGTVFTVGTGGADIAGFRIWNPGNGVTVASRVIRLWLPGGTQVSDATFPFPIDETFAAGWNEYVLPSTYHLDAGTAYVMSWAVGNTAADYGVVQPLGTPPAVGNITIIEGSYNLAQSLWPTSTFPGTGSSSTYYGGDILTGQVGGGGPTGTGTPTDVQDTASGTATFTDAAPVGTGTPTDVQDTASGSATFTSSATGAPTDAQDTSSGSGTYISAATGTATDTQDTASATTGQSTSASGTPTDQIDLITSTVLLLGPWSDTASDTTDPSSGTSTGSGAPTDTADAAAGTATFTSSATGAATDDQDAAAGAATFASTATGAATDTADAAAGTATASFTTTGSGATTDDRDTASGVSSSEPTSNGSGTPTDVQDLAAGAASVSISAAGAATDVQDLAAGAGTLTSTASGAASDQSDIASGTGVRWVIASGNPTDSADTAAGQAGQNAPGSGAPTDTADAASGSGTVSVAATGAATDTADTASGAATLTSTASGATTDTQDAASGAGAALATSAGAGAATDAQDAASGAGTLTSTASGALTDDRDTAAGISASEPQSNGSGTPTDAQDAASGAGTLSVAATGAATDTRDAGTGSGTLTSTATGALTDEQDAATGVGASEPVSSATGAASDGQDTASGAATFISTATGAATDDRDTAAGQAGQDTSSSGAAIDTQDSASGSGTVSTSATGTATDTGDTATGTATYVSTATGAATDLQDSASGVGDIKTIASGSPADTPDQASGSGAVLNVRSGSGAPTDAQDISSGSGTFTSSASGAATDSRDVAFGGATQATHGFGGTTDQRDLLAGAGIFVTYLAGSATDAQDSGSGSGTVTSPASGAGTDGQDSSSGTAIYIAPPSHGTGAATDQADTVFSIVYQGLITLDGNTLTMVRIDRARYIKRPDEPREFERMDSKRYLKRNKP